MMKILVISNTPWSADNSFGNTFSNLFSGMPDVQIYNICCKHGQSNNDVVVRAFQMTDKSVLKSIYRGKRESGWEIDKNSHGKGVSQLENTAVSESAVKKRRTQSFIIRDLIWKLGRWRKNEKMWEIINEAKPDVIYLPIYAANFMCDVQSYIIKKLGVPIVGHISDDVYGYTPRASLLARLYKSRQRKKLRALISECSYLEVFAENMKREYEAEFGIPCHVIGKGIDASALPPCEQLASEGNKRRFVYTGNLGAGRYDVLLSLGKALDCLVDGATLDIYSATLLTDEMKRSISVCRSIRFMGCVGREEVEKVQSDADVLVHVEGFTPAAIHSARMSFSTKIIDYMLTGKPILAIGPAEVNSIELLKNKRLAVVADSCENIKSAAESLLDGSAPIADILANVREYLTSERDIRVIQKGIKERLDALVRNG